ncbi:hypothetical protein J2067_004604 [Erwinia rhapontici]|nr:hypothetical protein [Erwinia rhapontici]
MQVLYILSLLITLWLWRKSGITHHLLMNEIDGVSFIRPERLNAWKAQEFRSCD